MIIGLLKYINFPNLKSKYAVRPTDASEGFITIIYNNSKTKKVTDYGLDGTYGLAALQELFFKLRTTQNCKKVKLGDFPLMLGCN